MDSNIKNEYILNIKNTENLKINDIILIKSYIQCDIWFDVIINFENLDPNKYNSIFFDNLLNEKLLGKKRKNYNDDNYENNTDKKLKIDLQNENLKLKNDLFEFGKKIYSIELSNKNKDNEIEKIKGRKYQFI